MDKDNKNILDINQDIFDEQYISLLSCGIINKDKTINNNFTNDKINISVNIIRINKNKSIDNKYILIERQHIVNSKIIRYMKNKKIINHSNLLSFVNDNIDFTIDNIFFNNCISNLINKEYIKKTKNINVYEYIP